MYICNGLVFFFYLIRLTVCTRVNAISIFSQVRCELYFSVSVEKWRNIIVYRTLSILCTYLGTLMFSYVYNKTL